MWAVAPPDMMRIVEEMQDHLKAMELVAAVPSRAEGDEITTLVKRLDDLPEELVNLARKQTGERALPSPTFRSY
jgi:hypothetical protein